MGKIVRMVWREIRRKFTFWVGVNDVPKWVHSAAEHWESKLGHRPYDLTKHFVGRTFIWRIHYRTIEQGKVSEEYYRKRIIR